MMIDADLMRRVRAFPVDAVATADIDAVVVLTSADDDSGLRGGTIADVDRIRAAGLTAVARQRARWRPSFANRAISEQFSAPKLAAQSPQGHAQRTAVRMPPPDRRSATETALFWVALQLLADWQAPNAAAKTAASKEVRAACGAAAYARAKNVDADLIEESLTDVAALCDALIARDAAIAANAPDSIGRHDDAVRAVQLLATGLPSAARLAIEGFM
ncbi:hypothetical protein ACIRRA_44645 [Nocardia sp. NPDC101769]|uniref:hypothetical protein n=1 Tax=Nocardia sp. NPDC101769 TaxID=3364333 RepID=UPI00382DD8CF